MSSAYIRPAKTKAAAVGERNRARWTHHLRKKLFALVKPSEFMNPANGAANSVAKAPWENCPRWATTPIRAEQMAIIELLQTRHLRVTGKEISRSEVLAVLMAEGLERTLNHPDFGGH